MGVHHSLDTHTLSLPEYIERELTSFDAIAVERIISKEKMRQLEMRQYKNCLSNIDKSDYLAPDEIAKLTRLIGENMANKPFRPTCLRYELSVPAKERAGILGFTIETAMYSILKSVNSQTITKFNLDDEDWLLSDFYDLYSHEEAVRLLKHDLRYFDEDVASRKRSLESWKKGDVIQSKKEFDQEIKQANQRLIGKLYYERNAKFAKKLIAKNETKQKILAITGSFHLLGKRSVIEYLKKAGYTISAEYPKHFLIKKDTQASAFSE